MVGTHERNTVERTTCPGCQQPFDRVRAAQLYCRPSCRVRAEWRAGRERPRSLFGGTALDNELPAKGTRRTAWHVWPCERDDLPFRDPGAS